MIEMERLLLCMAGAAVAGGVASRMEPWWVAFPVAYVLVVGCVEAIASAFIARPDSHDRKKRCGTAYPTRRSSSCGLASLLG